MGKLNKGGYLGGFDQLKAPDAPTIAVTAGNEQLSIAITAPSYSTGTIDYYCATAIVGGVSTGAEGSSSPVTITGLTNGTEYTVSGVVKSEYGSSPLSGTIAATPSQSTRALFGGGNFNTNELGQNFSLGNFVQFIEITTDGDTSDFGDLTEGKNDTAASIASSTRGIFHGGSTSGNVSNVIEYFTVASTGNGTDFGDFIHSSGGRADRTAGASNSTRGVIAGGRLFDSNTNLLGNGDDQLNGLGIVMQYVTIANTGNATDFGDLSSGRTDMGGNICNGTRAVFHGGQFNISTTEEEMAYITVASTGNTTDFGDAYRSRGRGGCSNSTRGIMFGGTTAVNASGGVNTIEYITIASTGNSTDFGDLSEHTGTDLSPYINCGGVASSTKAVLASAERNGAGLEKVTIASTGNATNFGAFSVRNNASKGYGSLSVSHGGIA